MQVYCLDFSPEETKAVTASKDGTWVVWNIDVRYAMDEDPKVLLPTGMEESLPFLGPTMQMQCHRTAVDCH